MKTFHCNDSLAQPIRGHQRNTVAQLAVTVFASVLPFCCGAQMNTGSTGGDGALDYSAYANSNTNIVIDMHDHPNGVYQYTYVKIPTGVTVSFIPNANNTPVNWLVQNNVVINGIINVSGQPITSSQGSLGGPGGYRGGNAANGNTPATSGQGPGGGAGGASYGYGGTSGTYSYGNIFLIPLLGGSGGGGSGGSNCGGYYPGGTGGGGAILIAASGSITLSGTILANAGSELCAGGPGSGGAVRLVASQITGSGQIQTYGGGAGRIRFDTYDNEFSGNTVGQFSAGIQPIIVPSTGQLPQISISDIGGVPVSPSPTGVLATPDAVISSQQNNPVAVVVNCVNLPLHTLITVSVKPMTGAAVSATGYNDTGTQSSSSTTLSISIPRGGGLIYATAGTSN